MNVFLSYAEADKLIADQIRSGLRTAGLNVWDTYQEVLPGENWAKKVGEALEKSEGMVVLLSPESLKSEWVRHEIEYALSSPRYRKRLIPVVVRPTREIPWILERIQLLRLKGDPEETVRHILKILAAETAART